MSRVREASTHDGFPIRGWFAETPPEFRRDFLALARRQAYAAGSTIFLAGEAGKDMFGLHSGVITLESPAVHPDAALMHMMWPGEWFGTFSVLLGKGRRLSAFARTDVILLRIPGDELKELLRIRPQWYAELSRDAVHGIDVAMQMAADLLIHGSSARCAAVLLRLAGRRWASGPEADLPIVIPASQEELAVHCNVSRNTFSRVVKDLAIRGLVALGYRSLTLNNPAQLRDIANAG
jgi:CRP-like cAMP-binding protein